jgi:hypothetical protein
MRRSAHSCLPKYETSRFEASFRLETTDGLEGDAAEAPRMNRIGWDAGMPVARFDASEAMGIRIGTCGNFRLNRASSFPIHARHPDVCRHDGGRRLPCPRQALQGIPAPGDWAWMAWTWVRPGARRRNPFIPDLGSRQSSPRMRQPGRATFDAQCRDESVFMHRFQAGPLQAQPDDVWLGRPAELFEQGNESSPSFHLLAEQMEESHCGDNVRRSPGGGG